MMSNEECRRALSRHIEAERAHDMEAIMDSLCEDCCYLVTGWELRGKPALQAMYERSMSALTDENMDEYLRAIDDPAVADWGPQHVVLSYNADYPLHHGMIVITRFRDGKVASEDSFFSVALPDNPDAFAGIVGASRIEPGIQSHVQVIRGHNTN
jgi:hypothetical protein